MDAITDLTFFRAVIESGGISAAARALGSSPPAVSRRLAALERRLGVRLAERGARRFLATEEGALLYERCVHILDQIRNAEAEVAARATAPRGRLRISAPCDFGRRRLVPAISGFANRHPDLDIHVVLSDAGLEPGRDDIDVALRIDRPKGESLIIRKLAETRLTACAAPAYLAQQPAPVEPRDLVGHNCLRLGRRDRLIADWRFVSGGKSQSVKVGGSLSSSSGELLRDWVLGGLGIGLEAYWDVDDDLKAGRLIHVLPDWRAPTIELFACYMPGKPVPPRIRAFVDFVASLQMPAGPTC